MSNLLTPISNEFKFIRPGGINTLSRQLDKYAQKQLNALVKGLKEVQLPTALHEASEISGNGVDTEYLMAVQNFFKQLDPEDVLYSDELKALARDPEAKSKPLTEFIDATSHASMYYEVKNMIKEDKLSLNAFTILNNEVLASYLFARAIYSPTLELKEAFSIYKNMKEEDDKNGGIKAIYNYMVFNAVIDIKRDNKIETGGETNATMAKRVLEGAKISFADGVLSTKILFILKQHVFNKDEQKLIDENKDKLNIADEDIPYLISYIKKSKIPIDKDNAEFYLAIALSNLKNNNLTYTSSDKDDEGLQDFDFSVKYYDDVKSAQTFNKESILCAAQLYYVMTLGDELGIFEVINTIITKEMPSGRVDITSKQLMKDLQQYFFNETFSIGSDGSQFKRTLPDERHMFYKQVFNAGSGNTIDGTAVNKEFDTNMNTLFEEVIKYIEKVERSISSSVTISRQNLYQAIEDLQYNLSTYCSGMVKVATPIINKELDFVVERFLMNDDIRKQLAPNGNGSFWKVIENVQRGQGKNSTSLLRNKAVFMHKILTAVANYTPVSFEDENVISEFVSTVEALIINNSQLEDRHHGSSSDDGSMKGHDWDHAGNDADMIGAPSMNGNGNGMKDEWNF